jgi:glycosyltransferase involved in cell wall biosynthesis|tara:strand:+ start:739 stop:1719 length:981 start_codon:yes stop_codon:yes gene_type:complete
MNKISLITQHDMNIPNGSTIRPKWQFEALKKNNFNNVELVDNFNETKLNKLSDTLIHAHQFSGKWIKDQKYFVDIHGLEHIQSLNLSGGFPIYSWKKYTYIAKSHYYKKFEINLFKNSTHLICSGEDIFDKVKKFQNSTVVRNGIFLSDFHPTICNELKVAVVGPFLPGTINYEGLNLIKKTVKGLPKIKFVFIGKTDYSFKNELNFKNCEFLGLVENYSEVLRSCSVLFSPYPSYAKYLGSKNKFLEAGACEMPIITTSSGAVDFKQDLLLIGDSSTELIKLIESMQNENERKKIGKSLRVEIEKNYNADVEIKKIIKLYKEYLD